MEFLDNMGKFYKYSLFVCLFVCFQPEGRAIHYAKTMTRYLTERALQLYYYTEILGKHVDFDTEPSHLKI
jgi:hypothetical protein